MDLGISFQVRDFLETKLESSQITIEPMVGDASLRQYYRILKGEISHVLMLTEPFSNEACHPFLNIQKHFQEQGVLVPNVEAFYPPAGAILLEDLGSWTLERVFWEDRDSRATCYERALRQLYQIHEMSEKKNCVAFQVEFNLEKFLWEMEYAQENFLEKICGISLSSSMKKALKEIYEKICGFLVQEPQKVCHRDYHSRNLMWKDERIRILDFQDARLGPVVYDLTSLLLDPYVALEENHKQKLQKLYFSLNSQSSQNIELAFNYQSIQRTFKICGSFSNFYNERKNTGYLKYLNPSVCNLHKALTFFPEFKFFKNILENEGLLERDYEKI